MKTETGTLRLFEYFNGELTPAQEQEIEEWAEEGEENRRRFEDARKEYTALRWGTRASLIRKDYSSVRSRITGRRRRRRWPKIAAVAAVAVFAVAGTALFLQRPGDNVNAIAAIGPPPYNTIIELSDGSQIVVGDLGEHIAMDAGVQLSIQGGEIAYLADRSDAADGNAVNRIVVPRGSRQQRIVLADGSIVWLNADSHLRYPLNFRDGVREVFLSGEAYFDIARDEDKPFIVHTDDQTVTVLGTEFNISAYPGDQTVQTTLVRGSVRVAMTNGYRQAIMLAGQQAVLDLTALDLRVSQVNTSDFTSWKEGMISIEKATMRQVLAKIARQYDVDFDMRDRRIDQIVLRGAIPVSESLDVVLSVLGKAGNVKFEMEKNGGITVKPNN